MQLDFEVSNNKKFKVHSKNSIVFVKILEVSYLLKICLFSTALTSTL